MFENENEVTILSTQHDSSLMCLPNIILWVGVAKSADSLLPFHSFGTA